MSKSITSGMHALDVTSAQKKQLLRFAEDAIEKVIKKEDFDRYSFQTVIGRGGEFGDSIANSIINLSIPRGSREKEWEKHYQGVKESGFSRNSYQVKNISEQLEILRSYFPEHTEEFSNITFNYKYPKPIGSDGYFVIPRWQLFADTYDKAVVAVAEKFVSFDKKRSGIVGPIKLIKRTEMFLERCDGQNVMILPAQMGSRYLGKSVSWVRDMLLPYEFGLGAFEVSIMLLTHRECFEHKPYLHRIGIGDRFKIKQYDAYDNWLGNASSFIFQDEKRRCMSGVDEGVHLANCAAVTAFLPDWQRKK